MKMRIHWSVGLALATVLCAACGKPEAAVSAVSEQTERTVSVVPPVGADTAPTGPVMDTAGEKPSEAAENPESSGVVAAPEKQPKPQASETPTTAPGGDKPPEPAPIPERIARVGDVVISGQEFARDLAMRVAQLSRDGKTQVNPNDRAFRAAALAEMIDARVLRWVASRAVTVTDEEVNREFDRGRRVVGSAERFQAYLKREGTDEAGLKALIRDRLCIEAYKKKRVDDAAISEEEVRKLYDQWEPAGRFDRKGRTADLLHISIHPLDTQPSDMENAKKAVEAARARIAGGEDFKQVAVEVSDDKNVAQTGGYYPEADAASLPPYIAERMFTLPVNELSEPFEGGGAWHLLKVMSVNEPGKVTFEKAHDQIRNFLLEGKRRDELSKAIEQAKYVMDIEIYKAELRPEKGPGSGAPQNVAAPSEPVVPGGGQGGHNLENQPAAAQ